MKINTNGQIEVAIGEKITTCGGTFVCTDNNDRSIYCKDCFFGSESLCVLDCSDESRDDKNEVIFIKNIRII